MEIKRVYQSDVQAWFGGSKPFETLADAMGYAIVNRWPEEHNPVFVLFEYPGGRDMVYRFRTGESSHRYPVRYK